MRLLPALLLAGAAGYGPATAQTPPWQREWRVASFECPRCSPADRTWLTERLNQPVTLAPTRFLNPLYEDCPNGVDYAGLRPTSPAEARSFFGSDRLLPITGAAPLAGPIRCAEAVGPPNTVARIVIDGANAFLLHETSAVLHLR